MTDHTTDQLPATDDSTNADGSREHEVRLESREAPESSLAESENEDGSRDIEVSNRELQAALAQAEAAKAARIAFEQGRVAARGRALERAHHLNDVHLRDPAGSTGLLEVLNHQHLLSLMVKRELRQRYLGSKVGLAWSYINPAVRFCTFYFVFGIILGRGAVPHFAIHLFAGMVMVNYFNDTFAAGSRSIIGNKSVVNKMPLPRQLYPIASMLVSLYHIGPQMIVLTGACYLTGNFRPTVVGAIAMIMAFTIIILLATAMGVMFSAVSVLYRDFTRVVQIFTNMLPFTVPMMYPYSLVTTRFGTGLAHSLYLDNPVAYAVLLMQRAFWYPTISPADARAATSQYHFQMGLSSNFPPHLFGKSFLVMGACLVFLFFANHVFSRLNDKLPDRLST